MGAQPDPYRQFLDYMNAKGGRILEIEFYQEQFGERFESNGTFFIQEKGIIPLMLWINESPLTMVRSPRLTRWGNRWSMIKLFPGK